MVHVGASALYGGNSLMLVKDLGPDPVPLAKHLGAILFHPVGVS